MYLPGWRAQKDNYLCLHKSFSYYAGTERKKSKRRSKYQFANQDGVELCNGELAKKEDHYFHLNKSIFCWSRNLGWLLRGHGKNILQYFFKILCKCCLEHLVFIPFYSKNDLSFSSCISVKYVFCWVKTCVPQSMVAIQHTWEKSTCQVPVYK